MKNQKSIKKCAQINGEDKWINEVFENMYMDHNAQDNVKKNTLLIIIY